MTERLKIAILGDTHFCRKEMRPVSPGFDFLYECPDYIRYSDMVDSVLTPILSEVKKHKPDFIISTGDFVEGGMQEKEKTYEEMKEAWRIMNSAGCPFLMAKGTHENAGAYNDIVLPEMSKYLRQVLEKAYFSYRKENCVFFFLDYLNYISGGEQDKWLEENLRRASVEDMRIFVIAHPPLYNWGRHFFNEPEFINRMIELFSKYPVDGYFCGHTHNQAVSFHGTDMNKGYLQVMASSVGFTDMGFVGLEEFHRIAEFTENDHFFWGVLEDSSPGFYILEIEGEKTTLQWITHRGGIAATLSLAGRMTFPAEVRPPEYRKTVSEISSSDPRQIKSACLHSYGIYRNTGRSSMLLNGVPLGRLPTNPVYAARRFIPLDRSAIKALGMNNTLEIVLPADEQFVIGSISLELLLYDNRIIHSEVAPELFVRGDFWKIFPQPREVIECPAHQEKVSLSVDFAQAVRQEE